MTARPFTIAALQLNPTIGDLAHNAARIEQEVARATTRGASLCVTPELSLVGYPPRDLLLDPGFVARANDVLATLAVSIRHLAPVLVGVPEVNDGPGRPLFNSTMLLRAGHVAARFRKSLLPTYDVFDEDRYFEPGDGVGVVDIDGRRIAVSVCEDVWSGEVENTCTRTQAGPGHRRYSTDPLRGLDGTRLDCFVNVSASPFVVGKQQVRERLLADIARRLQAPVIYVNQVGGNDDLVFDGRSIAFGADGQLIARASAFAEDMVIAGEAAPSLPGSRGTALPINPALAPEEELWDALVLGTRDYARKCGFSKALLGLSGGIDSALTAAVACEALGSDAVEGVLMPSPWTSQSSLDDAFDLAKRLGMRTRVLPITPLMEACDSVLAPAFQGRPRDTTEENIQARLRGTLLMALANKFGALLLTTGNKSELSVGYCTLYGDMAGGLAVIADVPKTLVFALSAWLNTRRQVIPQHIIDKAPSAELRPGQTDQDDLPPYDVLDEMLDRHLQDHQSEAALVARGFAAPTVTRVVRLVAAAEFKRRQAAPGLKVTDRAFGTGWRMPVARRIS
jgi:NAD+ synthase/NAD+ synthase (glutamine-hydrolysing)